MEPSDDNCGMSFHYFRKYLVLGTVTCTEWEKIQDNLQADIATFVHLNITLVLSKSEYHTCIVIISSGIKHVIGFAW